MSEAMSPLESLAEPLAQLRDQLVRGEDKWSEIRELVATIVKFKKRHWMQEYETEDVVQEVMTAIYRQSSFLAHPMPVAFIARIVSYKIVDLIRREHRSRRRPFVIPEDNIPATTMSPDEEAIHLEQIRRIRELFQTLSDGQRQVAVLYFVDNIPAGEIARRLGLSPGRIKYLLHLTRRRLARYEVC